MPFATYIDNVLDSVGVSEEHIANLDPSYKVNDLYIPLVYARVVVEDRYQHQGGVSNET